ncbi:hypothetical protein BC936DRAFT_146326 [Jimgerdemannia flammicorona]|uniref:Uncharacterized protein n=1 Tax=Jimgerdemannia flammicorona TaxID=994334 RepID=A0A433D7W7_9FUNG|nr:hypothetical protein BC936DRAFT_146326 [Jimgerdemannia flammicorona]
MAVSDVNCVLVTNFQVRVLIRHGIKLNSLPSNSSRTLARSLAFLFVFCAPTGVERLTLIPVAPNGKRPPRFSVCYPKMKLWRRPWKFYGCAHSYCMPKLNARI